MHRVTSHHQFQAGTGFQKGLSGDGLRQFQKVGACLPYSVHLDLFSWIWRDAVALV